MQVIKATKTKLYHLVQRYSEYELPRLKDTEFIKANFAFAYWLKFSDINGKQVVAYIEAVMGRVGLRISCRPDKYDKVFHPDLEELEGMIYEI